MRDYKFRNGEEVQIINDTPLIPVGSKGVIKRRKRYIWTHSYKYVYLVEYKHVYLVEVKVDRSIWFLWIDETELKPALEKVVFT